jgi:hypothetical protein
VIAAATCTPAEDRRLLEFWRTALAEGVPDLHMLNLVVADMAASLALYRHLRTAMPEDHNATAAHVQLRMPGGARGPQGPPHPAGQRRMHRARGRNIDRVPRRLGPGRRRAGNPSDSSLTQIKLLCVAKEEPESDRAAVQAALRIEHWGQ